ncbi:hypothetical protein DRO48_00250 [Candidatus Bathyarchaeota archaeon]|nr:MAG: hypothetical protein DRO48_00250 [Candidatus Bathyarchaeota archaeon]
MRINTRDKTGLPLKKGLKVGEIAEKIRIDGEGRLFVDGIPALILTRSFLALIQQTMEELIGERGAALIFYRAGFRGGYNLAKSLKAYGLKPPAILQACLHTASLRGWGVFGVAELDLKKPKVDVVVRASPAEEMKGRNKPACHLICGFIAGIMQYLAEMCGKNVKIRGTEKKCIAKGDQYCEIVAEPPHAS